MTDDASTDIVDHHIDMDRVVAILRTEYGLHSRVAYAATGDRTTAVIHAGRQVAKRTGTGQRQEAQWAAHAGPGVLIETTLRRTHAHGDYRHFHICAGGYDDQPPYKWPVSAQFANERDIAKVIAAQAQLYDPPATVDGDAVLGLRAAPPTVDVPTEQLYRWMLDAITDVVDGSETLHDRLTRVACEAVRHDIPATLDDFRASVANSDSAKYNVAEYERVVGLAICEELGSVGFSRVLSKVVMAVFQDTSRVALIGQHYLPSPDDFKDSW